jgi:multiple sugar transport system permease protein
MYKKICKFLIALLTSFILIFYLLPLYWLFVNSVKDNIEIFSNPPTVWPHSIQLINYIEVFTSATTNIIKSFSNSFLIASCTTLLTMTIALPAAYALAKFRIKLTNIILLLFIIGQMLSPTVKLIPLFITFRDMQLINTSVAVIIALGTFTIPFAVLIMRPYFLSIPSAINESALIDGCGKLSAFIKIIIPISYPGIIVAAVFNFLSGWSDLVYPLTFLTDQKKRPMITNIYTFIGEYGTRWNILLSFAVVSVLPVIVLFILLQRYIVGGIMLGSVKG